MLYLVLTLFIGTTYAEVTLKEAFEAAKLNMETLKKSDALIEQANERKGRARAGVLPTLTGVGSYTRIDPPDAPGGGTSAFTLTKQYSYALRLQQPLIRGGTVSAFQFAKEDILLAEFQKNASEVNLYQLVINSFYNLFIAQVDLENLKELAKFSTERVKELKNRTSVGKSRRGELIQAETQLLTVQSQVQLGEYNLKSAEENFEFYTKLKPMKLNAIGVIPLEIPDFSEYQQKLNSRPDVLAKIQEVRLAEKQVEISKGAHYPSLDLVSNYYFDRTGILATSKWDAALVVSMPLFQGGGVEAQVRESVEKKRFAELNSFEFIRTAKRDLEILYQNYRRLHLQLKTLRSAVTKAEEAYKLNLADYRYGQATNLEVLASLNLFIDTKRSYDSILAQANMTFKNLEASVGVLP